MINSMDRKSDLGKCGPVPKARANALKNARLKNTRKTRSNSIFVEEFTPHQQYISGPINNKPLSCQNNAKINQEQFSKNQNKSSSSMEKRSKHLSEEYRKYQQKFNYPPLKTFDTKNCDEKKFEKLAKDPKANKDIFHKTTLDETRAALHSEMEGIVDNSERIKKPLCKSIDLDFNINGPGLYTHMDVKHPVGSKILKKK